MIGEIYKGHVHAHCGGSILETCEVAIYTGVPGFKCQKCESEFDATDHEEFEET